jgi:hypothetical protein
LEYICATTQYGEGLTSSFEVGVQLQAQWARAAAG